MSVSNLLYYGLSSIDLYRPELYPFYNYLPENYNPLTFSFNQYVSLSGDFTVYSEVDPDTADWWIINEIYSNESQQLTRHGTISSIIPDYYDYLGEFCPIDPQYWYKVVFVDPNIPTGMVASSEIQLFSEYPPYSPTPLSASYVTQQGQSSINITLSASDFYGGLINYNILDYPFRGSLSGTAPDLTYYFPDTQHGIDELYFNVDNGLWRSGPTKIEITIEPSTITYIESPVSRTTWSITAATQHPNYPVSNAIDNRNDTAYANDYRGDYLPGDTIINMGSQKELKKVIIFPRQDMFGPTGNIIECDLYTSLDNSNWTLAVSGAKAPSNGLIQKETIIDFPQVTAQYFKITVTNGVDGYFMISDISAMEMVPKITGPKIDPPNTISLGNCYA